MEHLSLYELNKTIGEVLTKNLEPSYWVVAEIGQMQTNQKGHCYLELVEKEEDAIKAKTRATIWSYTYRNLSTWFHGITGQNLKAGMKILFNATIQFHEVYGFSLNIRDIDAQYTLGERAKKRQEIIVQLQEDGIIEMNKELDLPIVPQRIAVISSETAAGFADFMDQLNINEFGYDFKLKLFNSVMQGDQAEVSIISSMHDVYANITEFDLLVIIRGGGASLDLDCFDSYDLGSHIAQFPIPVITGIGHERDETIADMVAHTKMKTPTAVAEFLISGCRNFEMRLDEQFNLFSENLRSKVDSEATRLDQLLFKFHHKTQQSLYVFNNQLNSLLNILDFTQKKALANTSIRLDQLNEILLKHPFQMLQNHHTLLEHLEKELRVMNPENVLNRGYSLTKINGININRISNINSGASITTLTRRLEVISKYQSSKKRI